MGHERDGAGRARASAPDPSDRPPARSPLPVAEALAGGRGVVVTGCGTSEHAARAIAALIADALGAGGAVGLAPRQAFDASLDPLGGGVCIAVSHSGGSTATVAALEAARLAGARTCLITAASVSEAREAADLVFTTPLEDASWRDTVGYLSPVLAGAAIAAALVAAEPDADAISAHIAACDAALLGSLAERAAPLADSERLLVVGSGLDEITAAEQALKIEEGAWIPAASLHLETLLHGHLPAAGAQTGLIAFLGDPRRREARGERTAQALRAAAALGVTSLLVSIGTPPEAADESGAEIVLPSFGPQPALGALVAGAIALQRITLALSERRGTNPDLLRRDDVRYRSAALLGAHKLRMFSATP